MSSRKIMGTCRLCGRYGKLSFEHVPPRAAFNDRPVIGATLEQAVKNGLDDIHQGKIQQAGMGAYTMCRGCNSQTGRDYVPRFVQWCRQGAEALNASRQDIVDVRLCQMSLLAVVKEVVAMFLSVLPSGFNSSDLRKFVSDVNLRGLPTYCRLFVYLNREGKYRSIPMGIRVDNRVLTMMSEVSFPPFGYLMTFHSGSPDDRLVEITEFADRFHEQQEDLNLRLHVLPTWSIGIGDYGPFQNGRLVVPGRG